MKLLLSILLFVPLLIFTRHLVASAELDECQEENPTAAGVFECFEKEEARLAAEVRRRQEGLLTNKVKTKEALERDQKAFEKKIASQCISKPANGVSEGTVVATCRIEAWETHLKELNELEKKSQKKIGGSLNHPLFGFASKLRQAIFVA